VIIVDTALKAREAQGKPIRVGMVGAGFMGQGLANQIANSVPGMRIAAIYNRNTERAIGVYRYAGCENVVAARTQGELDDAVRRGVPVVAEDPLGISRSPEIDVLVDVTGSVEFGAQVLLEAFRHGKPAVLMNAEVDSTIGPILRVYARENGAILSACEGDEPGLQLNLYRWVVGLGLIPRVIGNVKGLQDPYRNPTTQQGWAERWGQNAAMVTSFADGSKISFEQSIVANATGFGVRTRGMSRGLKYDGSIMEIQKLYDIEELRALGGIVDYTVGPPLTKIFILAEHADPKQRHYLNLYKMGEGPLYPFWTPYHLVHFEVPNAIARVVLFGDEVAPPLRGCERGRDEREAIPARGAGPRLRASAPRREGSGPHVRRRRAPGGPTGGSAARRAIPAFPRRNMARRNRPRAGRRSHPGRCWSKLMKVVIFCGGLGMRLREYSESIPKPMVPVGYRPILWHLMRYYAHFGHKEFILCLGYKADCIKKYFLDYDETVSNDFVMSAGGKNVELLASDIQDWQITFVDTGMSSNIGQRLKLVQRYVDDDEMFLANYSDGLSDLPLPDMVRRLQHEPEAVASFAAVAPTSTFSLVQVGDSGRVRSIRHIRDTGVRINGGFFVFRNQIFDYMRDGEELVEEPFRRLAAEGKLLAHVYDGFWACMDTFREKQLLEDMYTRGQVPWEVWKPRLNHQKATA